jgi:UMF1 family MFS transporter
MTNNKKIHRAWSMYDWANSAYNLVITSTVFPAYYNAITTTTDANGNKNDMVSFLGHSFHNTALSNYAIATAYLIVVFLSPILSSIADIKGNKKRFMQFFCLMGSLACCGLYFFGKNNAGELNLGWGLICFVIAAIGYCGSIVFYNAFLPEIATHDKQDSLSANGFAYGYIGSVLLQVFCFTFFFKPEWYGMQQDEGLAARISFLLVGIWWLLFALIPFYYLPKGTARKEKNAKSLLVNSIDELKKVARQVNNIPVLKLFLLSFFLYSMGVQTVMLAAANFGVKELSLPTDKLIITILIIQLVAVAGAKLMAWLSGKIGNLLVLLLTVVGWIGICIAAYFIQTDVQFFVLAAVVGLVMGGIQSLSRSTYAKLMPETNDKTSYFSFYDVTEKLAIVIGMFSFAFIEDITGSMRNSILALICYFAVGGAFLYLARRKQISA